MVYRYDRSLSMSGTGFESLWNRENVTVSQSILGWVAPTAECL
jgi:hypothetical protein